MNISFEIGQRIRFARRQQGMNQKKLGEAVGVTTSSVGHYEIGKSKPSIEVLIKIADVCQVTVDWLVRGGNETEEELELASNPPPVYRSKSRYSDMHRDVLEVLLAKSERTVEDLQQIVRNLSPGKDKVIGEIATRWVSKEVSLILSASMTGPQRAVQMA